MNLQQSAIHVEVHTLRKQAAAGLLARMVNICAWDISSLTIVSINGCASSAGAWPARNRAPWNTRLPRGRRHAHAVEAVQTHPLLISEPAPFDGLVDMLVPLLIPSPAAEQSGHGLLPHAPVGCLPNIKGTFISSSARPPCAMVFHRILSVCEHAHMLGLLCSLVMELVLLMLWCRRSGLGVHSHASLWPATCHVM